jgi:hypothetical protein
LAIAGNTPIPVPQGWTIAKALSKGSLVYSNTGLPIQVTKIFEYTPVTMYRVVMSDGVYVDVDGASKFPVNTLFDRQTESRWKGLRKRWAKQKYASPVEMLDHGLTGTRDWQFYAVKNTEPIHFPTEDHPVPPFIAGMWMTKRNVNSHFTINPSMLGYVKRKISDCGWTALDIEKKMIELRPSIRTSFLTKYTTIPTLLPEDYYFGSVEQRLELLRGLVAIRPGCFHKKKEKFFIFSRDLRFLINIQSVCESLGMKTQVFENRTSLTHQLCFRTIHPIHPEQETTLSLKNSERRTIKEIQEIEPVASFHVETQSPIVVGQGFLPIWH